MRKKIGFLFLAVIMLLSFAGCGGTTKKGVEGTLAITVYSAGYGTEWIDEAVRLFKEDNPGVEVDLETSPLAFSSVQTMLENGNCTDDIILVGAANYRSFISRGYLEDLSGMYETVIPGTEKKVKDVVAKDAIDKYTTEDGKIYGIPWQENFASGLVYNKSMFERYGWDEDLPETMDEFWDFCDRIVKDTEGAITPLTYGGADGNGYLYTNFPQWLMEYYGYDGFMEFLQLESPAVYEEHAEGRTKIYETIARLTKGKTDSGNNITLPGSEGATAITAQTNFVNGQVAMIVNGQWFMTEMAEYLELRNFEVGFLPMPHINADKKSGDGQTDTSDVRFTSDNGVMAIPSTAVNKDLAEKFLVHMLTSESYSSFVKATHGLLRPLRGIEVDTTGFDDFTLSAYEYFNANGNAKVNYSYSKDLMIENSELAIFFAYNGGFFSRITGAATYEQALEIARGCVANEISCVYEKWDSGANQWK